MLIDIYKSIYLPITTNCNKLGFDRSYQNKTLNQFSFNVQTFSGLSLHSKLVSCSPAVSNRNYQFSNVFTSLTKTLNENETTS